jgi:hypothetical protein
VAFIADSLDLLAVEPGNFGQRCIDAARYISAKNNVPYLGASVDRVELLKMIPRDHKRSDHKAIRAAIAARFPAPSTPETGYDIFHSGQPNCPSPKHFLGY